MTVKLPRPSRKGYFLPGDSAQAVFFHGYTGSPYDLRPVSEYLSSRGIAVHVPLLRGHGTKPDQLFSVTAHDWLQDAEKALADLDDNRPIILGGLSMGALIAIALASRSKNIQGLILFSPSLKLSYLAELTIFSAELGLLNKNTSIKKISGGSDIADPVAKAKTPAYLEMPIAGLLQLEKLRLLALQNIRDVKCPIFLAFGTKDSAINAAASHDVMLGSARTTLIAKFYSRSKHVITLDYDRDELARDLARFLLENCGIAL